LLFAKDLQMTGFFPARLDAKNSIRNSQPGQLQSERGWTGSSDKIELRTEIISG
jgi:hypothetical protein